MKARLPLIAALAVALLPTKASAQAWVSNPDFSEGVGIRAGNFELHPSFGAEFGYDSNLFRASKDEGIVDVWKIRATPSLTLNSLGSARRDATTAPNYVFAAGAHLSYNQIIPVESKNSEASKRSGLGAGADFKLNIFPRRKIGFDLAGNYARILQTEGRSDELAGDGFNRDTVRGGAGVTWRPGGGVFEWRLGYNATFHYFENSTYQTFDNLQHEIGTRGRWRFLPRSALLFDSSYSFVRYTNRTVQTDGDSVRSRIGFHGLVTYHLALMGMVGWAASFYKSGDRTIEPRQFDSVIANAEARWFIQSRPDLETATIASGLSSVALGYARSFSNSYYGSFYQRDRGYLQFSMFLLGAIAGGLEFGVSRVGYPEVVLPNQMPQAAFSQVLIDSRLFGEYRFTDTIAMNATVQYDQLNSDPVNNEPLDYSRWQAYLGVRWFM